MFFLCIGVGVIVGVVFGGDRGVGVGGDGVGVGVYVGVLAACKRFFMHSKRAPPPPLVQIFV